MQGFPAKRSAAGGDGFLSPRQGRVEYPKAGGVLLGFQVLAVSDQHFAIGLPAQRLLLAGWGEAGSQEPGAGIFQLVVERVDSVYRCFGRCRWVEVAGEIIRNQIWRDVFSSVV
jgi:hypothetical protein